MLYYHFVIYNLSLRAPTQQPFILYPSLFSSLEKFFHTPIYADAMEHASITNLATLEATPLFLGYHRILQYLDFQLKVMLLRDIIQIVVMTNYIVVLIQHQVVHPRGGHSMYKPSYTCVNGVILRG
jgi:hypothetical protein